MHKRLTGQIETCRGSYHYTFQCFDGRVSGVINATTTVEPVTITVYYTGGSKTVTAEFRPPLQLALTNVAFAIPHDSHLIAIEYEKCKYKP